MKKLRSIAGGDTHTIIYLKMLLLSLKDEGKLYFEGVEDNFVSEIVLALDEDAENVKLTLAFLQRQYVQGSAENGKNSLRLDRKCCNETQMKQTATI
ncbi:MAG: phage replisome organizer N-terminal domain-containing protein [Lachnospiraceae bacterium]|nr:phage replisome organizer N-terminal domain-containing protein [Lachnospiraceae bacterium]